LRRFQKPHKTRACVSRKSVVTVSRWPLKSPAGKRWGSLWTLMLDLSSSALCRNVPTYCRFAVRAIRPASLDTLQRADSAMLHHRAHNPPGYWPEEIPRHSQRWSPTSLALDDGDFWCPIAAADPPRHCESIRRRERESRPQVVVGSGRKQSRGRFMCDRIVAILSHHF
jgi:hypothetical protein